MIQGRCPICSKSYEIATLNDLPSFPFCCERCRLIDLGRWADGKYVIPGSPEPTSPANPADDEDDPA
ncbi:MAG: DNA gyrase inhibitor YacG, partial [Isosphaeraceae bacterium]